MMREKLGGEENDVSTSSGKIGRGNGSGIISDKVGSNRYRAIAKSRRGESSRNSENGSKQNSGSQTLHAQR